MSSDYKEIWEYWYKAQLNEILSHHARFTEELPTLTRYEPFNAEEDAQALRKAMKGLGTDEKKITEILTNRVTDQRQKIRETYQLLHGRDLIKDLKKELSGDYEKVILALMKPRSLLLADSIKKATKGAGTDEDALIEIFCSRDDESIKIIRETFESEYDISLEKVVRKETGGSFEKFMMSLLAAIKVDVNTTPEAIAEELASDVKEDRLRVILTSYTFPFLKQAFVKYTQLSGQDFTALIKKKAKGDTAKAMTAIYHCAYSRTEFYARRLHEAMKGAGTDDTALIRIIVSRCEIDLKTIKEKFQELYGKPLDDVLKKEVSGDYRKALMSLISS